ncbi:MAG: hypothetical protein V3V35_09280, partial [Dehalococcoidia bacterium]
MAPASVRGVVIDVQTADVVQWESITVREEDGTETTFLRGGSIDPRFWRASHLREHMIQGQPVRVEYRARNRGRVAIAIGDAE